MVLRTIFVDLNSYFASVEQAEDPKLIGLPVAVVPMMAETTCCLAASYPAKAKGVRTGTTVRDARKLCPGIRFVKADHSKYVEYHHRIIEAVERCFPIWKVFSIDEMAIQLFGRERDVKFARAKAFEIKKQISKDVHPALTCSIGIGPNRYIAKIASDMQKPDGLTVIQTEELPERLFNLALRDFPGIGPRMEKRLIEARCSSVKRLYQQSPSEMQRLWGSKVGYDLWRLIRGEEIDERETERASISHSRVLPPLLRTREHAWSNLVALLSKAAMRLRQEGFFAKCLQLNLKFLDKELGATYWEKRARFFETQDTVVILKELTELWSEAPNKNRIFKIGVVLSHLISSRYHQLSLWENPRHAELMRAVDKLNKKRRKNLVVFGASAALDSTPHAPIAFSHIPEEYE